jgi:hypothetical protein
MPILLGPIKPDVSLGNSPTSLDTVEHFQVSCVRTFEKNHSQIQQMCVNFRARIPGPLVHSSSHTNLEHSETTPGCNYEQ